MKKTFAISLVLFIIVLTLFDAFWSNWIKKQTNEKQIWVLNKVNEHYNIAFIGSSRVFTGINIDSIKIKTNKTAINLGCDGASLMENYVVLKQFLSAGNKIDSLYLQLDKFALIDMNKAYSYPFHDYLFLNKLQEDEVKEAIIKYKGFLRYIFWRFLPYLKYAEFNNFYNPKVFIPLFNKKPAGVGYNVTAGSGLINLQMPDSLAFKAFKKNKQDGLIVDTTSIYYANKIVTLCKSNNIKCILFKVPMYSNFYNHFQSSLLSEQFLMKLSKETNCRFIDFQQLKLASNKDCFKDFTHLNKNGANYFSVFLADSIMTN